MTMPKLDTDLFDQATPALEATLLHAKMFKYQKRAIQYEIQRRKRANELFTRTNSSAEKLGY